MAGGWVWAGGGGGRGTQGKTHALCGSIELFVRNHSRVSRFWAGGRGASRRGPPVRHPCRYSNSAGRVSEAPVRQGRGMRNSDPPSERLLAAMVPSMASMILRQMARPRPVPPEPDRKSGGEGKSGDLGGRRII